MTEKRFIYIKLGDRDEIKDYIIDNNQNNHFKHTEYHFNNISDFEDLFDMLNNLVAENEQLREEIKDFQDLLTNRESELLKPVWDKIYSEFENIVYAEKGAIINLLNECYDEIMKKELQE